MNVCCPEWNLFTILLATERYGRRLALLLRIREVQGSDLRPKTGYPEGFRGFPQSLQANASTVLRTRLRPLPSTTLPIHDSLIILSFDTI
jgi:hypothetical protein